MPSKSNVGYSTFQDGSPILTAVETVLESEVNSPKTDWKPSEESTDDSGTGNNNYVFKIN